MAQTIEAWLNRQLKLVEEDGTSTKRIRLIAGDGGHTWERWDGPFAIEQEGPGAAKLANEIEEVIQMLASEWPQGRHTVLLIAEDGEGLERSRYPKSVAGKATTKGNTLMQSGGEAALASSMAAQADTMKHILACANSQLSVQKQTLETQAQQISDLLDLHKAQREQEILTMEGTKDAQTKLLDTVSEQAPVLLEMLSHIMKSSGNGSAKSIAATAAQTVAEAAGKNIQ